MNRREFLEGGAASVALGLCGCATGRRGEDEVRRAMRDYVSAGLFGGIVCASNHGTLVAEGNRTLDAEGGPMTPRSLFDLASVGKTQTASL